MTEPEAHYHDPHDRRYLHNLRAAVPDTVAKLMAFDDAALRSADPAIPRKYTELMAVAVALTTQCPWCIEGHVTAARKQGASEAELAETVMIATALRAGAAVSHGLMAMKFYDHAGDQRRPAR